MKRLRVLFIFIAFVVISFASTALAYERDWNRFPAWIEVTGAHKICAVGDIHGAFDEFSATLEALRVAKRDSENDFRFTWTGRDTVLVLTGDFNDRGLYSKQIYDAVMDLEKQALEKGGRIIALLGNHEAMLLNGQVEDWAKNLTSYKKQHYQNTLDSFARDGVDFHKAISENGLYGKWIRNRPLFAIVNGYMFVHGGFPNRPVTRSTLAVDFQEDVTRGDWKKGIFMNHDSVLWNRDWWKNQELVNKNIQTLGVMGVVFGHTVGALGPKGSIKNIGTKLVNIDVGMTPAYGNSKGGGLIISTTTNGLMIFRAVYPDRPEEILFSVKMPASAYANGSRLKIINR
ncbi:MAG: hypothetical protein Kow0029_30340 [Candidatus Rifleibacteriota bacterium]